jgi:hypothetical protein
VFDFSKLINQDYKRLNKKYKGLAWLPLDLPKFEIADLDKFLDIWEKEQKEVWRQHIDRGAEGVDNPQLELVQWNGLSVFENTQLYRHGAWGTKYNRELAQVSKELLNRIMTELPFLQVRSVRFWSANKEIPKHYDGNMPSELDGKMLFPSEFRIMLYDENPRATFWLTDAKTNEPGPGQPDKKFYVDLPSDTNSFAWNNEDFLHGADFDPQYKKILVVVKGWPNVDRLEELIDRSITKYTGTYYVDKQ